MRRRRNLGVFLLSNEDYMTISLWTCALCCLIAWLHLSFF
uniref:Uncharacterized protein n=1 Tax=Arundo donax TaxID=35708 RepID=A0A0A9F1G5_ARUDO